MKHALAARSDEDAVRLFRGVVEDMLAHGELPTLLSWLEMLPAGLVRQHQDLAGYKAWLLFMSGRAAEAHRRGSTALVERRLSDSDDCMLSLRFGERVSAVA